MTLSTRLMGSRNVNVERRITNMVAKPQGTLRETAGKRECEGVAGGRGVGVSHRKQCTKGKPQNVKAEIKFTSKKGRERKAKSKSNM